MDQDRRVQMWMAGGFLVVIIAIAVIAGLTSSGTVAPSGFQTTVTSAITATDWVRGNKTAKVSIIEYGDFQCPACGAYEPMVQQLEHDYTSADVQFVFRNFPLPQHANAPITAQTAEAAGLQGKYWEMHDLLYQKQAEWSDVPSDTVVAKYINGYAQSLGLDMTKFSADIYSTAVKQKIQNDVASANAAKVDHTPTFFVNLMQIPNPQNAAEFKVVIDAALASTSKQQ